MLYRPLSVGLLIPLALGLAGCNVSFEDDDDSVAATPTRLPSTPTPDLQFPTDPPTPVPTPTAVPPNGYRVSRWILSETAGADLDQDQAIDNGFLPIYSQAVETVGQVVYATTYELMSANGANPQQARTVATALQQSVQDYYSVESFNAFSVRAIAAQDLNMVQLFQPEGSPTSLGWYEARVNDEGFFAKEEPIGVQSGQLAGGEGMYGPASMALDFSALYISDEEGQVLELGGRPILNLGGAWASFYTAGGSLEGGQLGGILRQSDFKSYMTALLPVSVCAPAGEPCLALDVDSAALEALEELYTNQADAGMWPLESSGERAVGVGFSWVAQPAVIR